MCLQRLQPIQKVKELLDGGDSPSKIWKKHPEYRKRPYLLSDAIGLLFVVGGDGVMGPCAIERMLAGKLTLEDARAQRKQFDKEEKGYYGCGRSRSELSTTNRKRYFLDGSMTAHDANRPLTDREEINISSRSIERLIDCRKLPTKRALALPEDEYRRFVNLVDLIVHDKLELNESLKFSDHEAHFLAYFSEHIISGEMSIKEVLGLSVQFPLMVESFMRNSYMRNWNENVNDDSGNSVRIQKKLTRKEALFLCILKIKLESGWSELSKVIKPNPTQEKQQNG
jgi:hypothetical protein